MCAYTGCICGESPVCRSSSDLGPSGENVKSFYFCQMLEHNRVIWHKKGHVAWEVEYQNKWMRRVNFQNKVHHVYGGSYFTVLHQTNIIMGGAKPKFKKSEVFQRPVNSLLLPYYWLEPCIDPAPLPLPISAHHGERRTFWRMHTATTSVSTFWGSRLILQSNILQHDAKMMK